MKRASICLFLALIMIFPMLPCRVQAAANIIVCQPGETIKIFFMLSEEGDQPDGVMGRLSYNTDIFTLLPSVNIIGMDGINILNRQPVAVSFRVNLYAPAGEYTIEVKVIEAYDADGKEYTNARVSPVQVHVELPATAAPEHTAAPTPTPTGKPLPLPSADSMSKKQIKKGDYVKFGRYPQTAEGNDMTPIEWLVLEVQGNKVLLLSRYGMDAKPYNTEWGNFTWEKCTLRRWLNKEFMNKAFSSAEQKKILMTKVDNSQSQGYSGWNTSGGNNTEDKLFLLSCGEAHKYLGVTREDDQNIKARLSPTEYVKRKGAWTSSLNKTADGTEAGWWWLRSPGDPHFSRTTAARVHPDGSLSSGSEDYSGCFIRPALWVSVDAISR